MVEGAPAPDRAVTPRGSGAARHAAFDRLVPPSRALIRDRHARTLLGYGRAASGLAARLGHDGSVARAVGFDPSDPGARRPDGPFDLVLAADVLERTAERDLDGVLGDIRSFSGHAWFTISTVPADEILDSGENAHRTIRDAGWWRERLGRFYASVETVPAASDDVCAFVTWGVPAATRDRLRRVRSTAKLRLTAGRLVGLPLGLSRLAAGGFVRENMLLDALDGRTVALVGNSPRLRESEMGAAIDGADVVIRLNRAPILSHRSHGRRTDWIATGVPVASTLVDERGVRFVLWMTKLRRMPRWMLGRSSVHLFPASRVRKLEEQIGRRPTTGFMMIDLLRRSRARAVTLYGFDFFESLSLSGWRTAAEVPHDFVRERALVEALIADDDRFTLRR